MNRAFIVILLIVSHSFLASTQNRTESSNALLEALISNGQVVGAAGSYSVNGQTLWETSYGYADDDLKLPFNIETQVRTASIAKAMTAVAVMQLVEQGLLDLEQPIDHYIPEFLQKGKTKITAKHLLSHTSGIDAYKNNKETENTINYETLTDAYAIFKDRKLRFEPGTQFFYTSYGYVVLGVLIEHISGLSYENYMQKHIWDKAGMSNTGIENPNVNREQATILYHRDRTKIKKAKITNLSNRTPAGGFYSTINDLIKFGNALLDNTLISKETFNLMREHHSLEKENNAYGFGFYLYGKQPNEGTIIGHNGAQLGTSTQLFLIPSLKTVIVVVSNTSGAVKDISTVAGNLIDISQQKE